MIRRLSNGVVYCAVATVSLIASGCADTAGTATTISDAMGGSRSGSSGGATTTTGNPNGVGGSSTSTNTSNGSGGTSTTSNGGSSASNGGSSASNGGSSASNGGSSASNGGSSASNGGSSASNGGSSTSNGGSSSGRGGASSSIGGASSSNGGSSSATGGKATTGGSSSATGGKSATGGATTTGGSSSAAGGKAATGGSSSATGGNASGGGTATATKFSFFAISYKAIQAVSGSAQGLGGDLRHGETGDGAGLRGADKICTEVAEGSMPGNGKTWRAFLSTSKENAIDRVGAGPWYDRLGRTFALTKAALLYTRPQGADATIINDLPNEDGTPNHAPDGTQVDNHDTLTGSNEKGTLYSSTAHCSDWTSSAKDGSQKPRVGHTWPRGTATANSNTPGMAHWISALDEAGCGAGVNIVEQGGPKNDGIVGSGGGYGGWYCFALTP